MRNKLSAHAVRVSGSKALERDMTFSFRAPKGGQSSSLVGWDYTRAWLMDSRLQREGVWFVPYQSVTILLPGQRAFDAAQSINVMNTGIQTRFLGDGVMVNNVGLVIGCYRFIDNDDNATLTRMVCFHDSLTIPKGTRVTQQQLEQFGTRWVPGTFSDPDPCAVPSRRPSKKVKKPKAKGKELNGKGQRRSLHEAKAKAGAVAPTAPVVPRTQIVDLAQADNDNEPVLIDPSSKKRRARSRAVTIEATDGQHQRRSKRIKTQHAVSIIHEEPQLANAIVPELLTTPAPTPAPKIDRKRKNTEIDIHSVTRRQSKRVKVDRKVGNSDETNQETYFGETEGSNSTTLASDDEAPSPGELNNLRPIKGPRLTLQMNPQANKDSSQKKSAWLPTTPYPGPVKKGSPQPDRLTIVKKHQVTGLTKEIKYPRAEDVDWNNQDWIRRINTWARQNYRRSDDNDRVETYKDRSRFLQIEKQWLVAYVHLQIVKRGVDTFNKRPHWDEVTDAFNSEFEGRQIEVDGGFTEPRAARGFLSISSVCNRDPDMQRLRGLDRAASRQAEEEKDENGE